MTGCPMCGEGGSIEAIALLSGPMSGLRAHRCFSCESVWFEHAELQKAPGQDFLSDKSLGAATAAEDECGACGTRFKRLPAQVPVYSCETCRLVVMGEGDYDRLAPRASGNGAEHP